MHFFAISTRPCSVSWLTAALVLSSLVMWPLLFICSWFHFHWKQRTAERLMVHSTKFLTHLLRCGRFCGDFDWRSISSLWAGTLNTAPVHSRGRISSLPNKMDELLLVNRTNSDFSRLNALCFTESWLHESVLDSLLQLPGFHLHLARPCNGSRKTGGGGICIYINDS